jgi:hypothetical protein
MPVPCRFSVILLLAVVVTCLARQTPLQSSVPKQGDDFMDPSGTGSKVIPFWRSGFTRSDDGKGTREALNLITHYLDASMVGGTLRRQRFPCFLPCNHVFT